MKITPCISPLLHLLLLYNTWGSASCQSIPPLRNVLWSDCLLCAIEVPYERRPPGLCDTAAEETGKFQWRTVILYWGLTTALIMVKLCMTFQDMRFNPLNDVKTIKSNFATNQQTTTSLLHFRRRTVISMRQLWESAPSICTEIRTPTSFLGKEVLQINTASNYCLFHTWSGQAGCFSRPIGKPCRM